MGLQYQVDSLEGLDDGIKALYTEKDGKFVLGVDGLPAPKNEDLEGLKAKVQELLNEKKTAQTKAQEAEAARLKAAEDAAKASGDIAALEKSWGDKLTAKETELKAQLETRDKQIYQLTVGQTAQKLASELAITGCSDVLLPHITSRLSVETIDGQPQIRVKDLQGNLSALSLDELKNEFRSNAAFKPLIAASNASGGGANGGQGGGAAKTLKEMSDAERIELHRTNPALFNQMVERERKGA